MPMALRCVAVYGVLHVTLDRGRVVGDVPRTPVLAEMLFQQKITD